MYLRKSSLVVVGGLSFSEVMFFSLSSMHVSFVGAYCSSALIGIAKMSYKIKYLNAVVKSF